LSILLGATALGAIPAPCEAAVATIDVVGAELFEGSPLSAPGDAIRELSRSVPVDAETSVQVLFESARFDVDSESRVVYRFTAVYRVDAPGAIDGWSEVSRTWRRWYQERPQIFARVLTPDGKEHRLDPADIGEFAPEDDGSNVYGDERTLRGPLPAVEVGAVIEETHVVRDHRPFFDAGVVRAYVFGRSGVPVHGTRLTVDVPADLPLAWVKHYLPDVVPERTERDGRVTLVFESGPLEAWRRHQFDLAPGAVARRPCVRFATAPAWSAVARAYSTAVDAAVAGSDLRPLVKRVKDLKKAAGENGAGRDEIVDGLLAAVQERVRYTGVEFGSQSIFPSPPRLTLDRRFGDCKDKATLLVALLRESGIDASVALLRTGPGNDVDPELPGMGRFDHAIVHVPGDPVLWIDPTDPFARAGELPRQDRDRFALVAHPDTEALTRTPPPRPEENARMERREVFLARAEAARIVETVRVRGEFERSFRRSFSRKNEAGLRDQLDGYVKKQYKAEELGFLEVADADDLSRPMELRLEALRARRGWTSMSKASVAIDLVSLVRDLPKMLREAPEEDEDENWRDHPVQLPIPFVTEIDYLIHPPPGYALADLPESGERSFGPASMSYEYSHEQDGAVSARLRFDTVQLSFTPAEAMTLRREIADFYEEDMPLVEFIQVGEAHLEAGRIREALAEFLALVELDPEEAIYRSQVARAYLAAGLGENALRAAERGVELAPEAMLAHRTLGMVRTHDALGRKFQPGMDHPGAESAFRRAAELDPDDIQSRGELAILLEHDDRGRRYSPGARLDEAAREYRALREDLETNHLALNELAVMLHRGHAVQMIELWKRLPRESGRDALYLAAVALERGSQAAIEEASRIVDDTDGYRRALQLASDWLDDVRRYGLAAELLIAGGKGDADSVSLLARAGMLRRLRHYDTFELSPDSPEGAVRALFVSLIEDDASTSFLDLLSSEMLGEEESDELEALSEQLSDLVRWGLRREGLSPQEALDWMLSEIKLSSAGEPDLGYRVRARILDVGYSQDFYVVRESSGHRILGLDGSLGLVGAMLLRRVEAGQLHTVGRWLDWLADSPTVAPGDDPLSDTPLRWLWPRGMELDAERARLAAASVMVESELAGRARELLLPAFESRELGGAQTGVDLAVLRAAGALEDHALVLRAAVPLAEGYPRSGILLLSRVHALVQLRRFDEADKLCRALLERNSTDPMALSALADVPAMRGDLAEHRKRLQSLIDEGLAGAGEYNNLAWLDIVEERVDDTTLQLAQQAVVLDDYSAPFSLHTLATVYAEMGYLTEARDVLLALLDNRTSNDLEGPDWYILGRIAEQYGVEDAALRAFEKVEPDGNELTANRSTYLLATRRIRALRQEPGTAPAGGADS
jgi:tetratricopeptide (TPR) repeat protein